MGTYKTASEALEAIIGTAENFMQDWEDDDGMSKADRVEFEAERGSSQILGTSSIICPNEAEARAVDAAFRQ